MPASNSSRTGGANKPKPPVNANSATKVNVAFPFSQIKVEEPSAELATLADLVGDLAELVRGLAPGGEADALVERARSLADTLR